ncbi:hypothetical protein CEXT_305361 [Caerostris extrusa]|uniref:Uncharacterized protein n=1 Tax=Caerostris extrusa TaxID=172846 RepID=A0AAV4N004_CAEEX|nr:hypothetical protein CEXT_305361 [Caerostris extrusa]
MGYLCHVPVGEITALVSQSDKNQGNISRTNLIFWDQELPETQQRKSFQAQELMEGAIHPLHWNLVKCVRKYCQMPRNESRKKVSQEYRWREYVHNLKMDDRFH